MAPLKEGKHQTETVIHRKAKKIQLCKRDTMTVEHTQCKTAKVTFVKTQNAFPDLPPCKERTKSISICATVPLMKKKDESNEIREKSFPMAMLEARYCKETWIYTDRPVTEASGRSGADLH